MKPTINGGKQLMAFSEILRLELGTLSTKLFAVVFVAVFAAAACTSGSGDELSADDLAPLGTTSTNAPSTTASESASQGVVLQPLVSHTILKADGTTFDVEIETGAVLAFDGTNPDWENVFRGCAGDPTRDGYIPFAYTLTNTTAGFTSDPESAFRMNMESEARLAMGDDWGGGGCADNGGQGFPGRRRQSSLFYGQFPPGESATIRGGVILLGFFAPNTPDGDFRSFENQVEWTSGSETGLLPVRSANAPVTNETNADPEPTRDCGSYAESLLVTLESGWTYEHRPGFCSQSLSVESSIEFAPPGETDITLVVAVEPANLQLTPATDGRTPPPESVGAAQVEVVFHQVVIDSLSLPVWGTDGSVCGGSNTFTDRDVFEDEWPYGRSDAFSCYSLVAGGSERREFRRSEDQAEAIAEAYDAVDQDAAYYKVEYGPECFAYFLADGRVFVETRDYAQGYRSNSLSYQAIIHLADELVCTDEWNLVREPDPCDSPSQAQLDQGICPSGDQGENTPALLTSEEDVRSALSGVLASLGSEEIVPRSPALSPCVREPRGQLLPGVGTDGRGLGSIAVLRFDSESSAEAAIASIATGAPSLCMGTGANIQFEILSSTATDGGLLVTYSGDNLDTPAGPEVFEQAYYQSRDLVVKVEATQESANREAVLEIAQRAFPAA